MRTLTPFICSSGGMSTASCPEPRNVQTMHRLAVTVNKTYIGVYINIRKEKKWRKWRKPRDYSPFSDITKARFMCNTTQDLQYQSTLSSHQRQRLSSTLAPIPALRTSPSTEPGRRSKRSEERIHHLLLGS